MSILKKPISHLLSNIMKQEKECAALCESLSKYRIKNYRQPPAFVTGISDTPLAVLFGTLCDFVSEIDDHAGTSLIIAPDERSAAYFRDVLSEMLDGVYLFPMRDFLFHNVDAFSREFEYERLAILKSIISGQAKAVVAVPEAVLSILPPEENFGGDITLSVGDEYPPDKLAEKLNVFGYTVADTVEGKGQYSRRGDIFDIFPPESETPIRIEFFGDEIDACGTFDIMTQRRTENVESFCISPTRELLLSDAQRDICKNTLLSLIEKKTASYEKLKKSEKLERMAVREELDKLHSELSAIEDGRSFAVDKYLPLLRDKTECLLSYCKGGIFAADFSKIKERTEGSRKILFESISALIEAGQMSPECTDYMKDISELEKALCSQPSVITSLFTASAGSEISGLYDFSAKQLMPFTRSLEALRDDAESYNGSGYFTVLMSKTERGAVELSEILSSGGIKAVFSSVGGISDAKAERGVVYCVYDEDFLQTVRGFELSRSRIAFLTEAPSGFLPQGKKAQKSRSGGKTSGQKILSYQDLKVGDYVVHTVHGIARYEGLKTLTVDGVTRDYIMLQYAGSDVLYIPVDQLDRVSRYASAGENVKLSSMSTKDWQKTKYKAKKAAKDMAKQLIELYAQRTRLEGYAFSPDTVFQKDFEERFEYEETDGQVSAINEIKEDMEKPHPMDRLLCGDVGFGKTEVALRAIFKCAMEGKQAAILVPTTILALQHYQTVLSRMKGFPFKIEMLSRFCKPKEAQNIVKRLATGETDIVIGTHKLLGKNIKFKDLGLLVVDEEQRFGVAHKERLKEISKQIDVLTLTATPIPRTLNMAMAGIRDMSVLEEAPNNRFPVQTYVLEHDDFLILEAIKKELRRAGQVFYLHNRVEGIEETAAKLRAALPDASIACAHGKMTQDELSDIWTSLVNGEIDILVCTTIIETGVDVPNVNTLIIEDADRLGLSQLHQLRGRIGRSSRKAYAYITWRRSACLTEIASKRLEALREFTEFGSGFKIAMRDLEIRGAGNILGAEQSGHMQAIGYDLYIKILEEAVLEEKGILPQSEKNECSLELRINAYIPDKYIRLPASRIEFYKKIAAVENSSDCDDILDELLDRFGTPPKEVSSLIKISLLRRRFTDCGIIKVERQQNKLVIFPLAVEKNVAVSLSLAFKGRILLSGGANPCYNIKLTSGEDILSLCESFASAYEKLVAASKGDKDE